MCHSLIHRQYNQDRGLIKIGVTYVTDQLEIEAGMSLQDIGVAIVGFVISQPEHVGGGEGQRTWLGQSWDLPSPIAATLARYGSGQGTDRTWGGASTEMY